MILELKHPTRGQIGTVEIQNGVVVRTKTDNMVNQVRQMKGWIENSVRVYAAANNWIVSTRPETTVVKPPSDMKMSKGEDIDPRR